MQLGKAGWIISTLLLWAIGRCFLPSLRKWRQLFSAVQNHVLAKPCVLAVFYFILFFLRKPEFLVAESYMTENTFGHVYSLLHIILPLTKLLWFNLPESLGHAGIPAIGMETLSVQGWSLICQDSPADPEQTNCSSKWLWTGEGLTV